MFVLIIFILVLFFGESFSGLSSTDTTSLSVIWNSTPSYLWPSKWNVWFCYCLLVSSHPSYVACSPLWPAALSSKLLVHLWAVFPISLEPHNFTCYYVCPMCFVCFHFFFSGSFHIRRGLFLQGFRLCSFLLFCRIVSGSCYFSHLHTSLTKKAQSTHAQHLPQAERYRLPLILLLTTGANGGPFPKWCAGSKQFWWIGCLGLTDANY